MSGCRIHVDSPGLLTTVQDLGRPGYAHLGISAAGAADAMALRIGNRLVGNDENAPALEMTLTGGSYRFDTAAVLALTGAVAGWLVSEVASGEAVRAPNATAGARIYLCVRGGLSVPGVLGSASTHLMSGIGGYSGRALRRGDVLEIGKRAARDPRIGHAAWKREQRDLLRVTAGPQADRFGAEFYRASYSVREDSNRMGVRLSGPAVAALTDTQLLTEGVSLGAVQVPPDGQPIILFVDHQTTGGYPKIANVISADLWKVGQLRPRDTVRFELVTIETALALLREQEEWIQSV